MARLLEVVDEIHRRGTTIIVVEQSVNVVLNLAERAVFMEKGEFRFTGPTPELLDRPDILRSVFIAGSNADEADTGDAAPKAEPTRASTIAEDARAVLQCRGVTKRFGGITAVDSVDLDLRDGEIIGLIGHNGAGELDEPSGGVAQKETEALGPLLLRVRERTGCSILVIEHDMPLLSSICDQLIALETGAVIATGTPDEVLSHPAVIESYLGTEESAINRSGAA